MKTQRLKQRNSAAWKISLITEKRHSQIAYC